MMARESRRKRDERRLGKPQRMIDMIEANGFKPCPWSSREGSEAASHLAAVLDIANHGLATTTPVVADNVGEYMNAIPKKMWGIANDFPFPVPPWKSTFIEFKLPTREGKQSGRTGCLIYAIDPTEAITLTRRYLCLAFIEARGRVYGPAAINMCSLAADGSKLTSVSESSMGLDLNAPIWDGIDTDGLTASFFLPALLTLSFLNCKNVTTTAVDPDATLNRERQKGNLKPFLRYHTINIEPMKQVLRTEGGIEANGLKKALHICRGHFATYSQDRPLFGKFAGNFWIPSHVRGEAKQGVVVADYNVNAPR